MVTPAVSVILPVLNCADYIDAALEGLCAQDLREIEIVVVDGGSADSTLERVEAATRRDPRIRLLHRPGMGLPASRNAGAAAAEAPFLSFHDGDDISSPDRLRRLFDRIRKVSGAAVSSWWEVRDRRLETPIEVCAPPIFHEGIEFFLPIETTFGAAFSLVRREAFEAVGGFDPSARLPHRLEDQDFGLRLTARGLRLENLPLPLYIVRRHGASMTSSFGVRSCRGAFESTARAAIGIGPGDDLALSWAGHVGRFVAERAAGRRTVIWGLGSGGRRAAGILRSGGVTAVSQTATNATSAPDGSVVGDEEAVLSAARGEVFLALAARMARAEIVRRLLAAGLEEGRDYLDISPAAGFLAWLEEP